MAAVIGLPSYGLNATGLVNRTFSASTASIAAVSRASTASRNARISGQPLVFGQCAK